MTIAGFCFLTYGWCAIKGKPFHVRPRKGVVEENQAWVLKKVSLWQPLMLLNVSRFRERRL